MEYNTLQICRTATGTHVPYWITHCHLPPSIGDIPAFTTANYDWYLEGRKAELTWFAWLHTEVVYPPTDGHPSQ